MKTQEERTERPRRRKSREGNAAGAGLIAVQSISCAVVLLIVLSVRLVGGEVFEQLGRYFQESLMQNTLAASLTALWEEEIPWSGGTTTTDSTESGTTTTTTEGGTTTTADASSTPPATGGGDAAANATVASTKLPEDASADVLKVEGKAGWPLEKGTLTSGFGYREDPFGGGQIFHRGLDIAADEGTAIAAMFFGTVTDAGESSSYGHYIKLYHGNGLEVMYAHCSKITATKGDTVEAGDKVAEVGSTGNSTGNHLHIEIRKDGISYNPISVVPTGRYV